jgi:putative membrane protein
MKHLFAWAPYILFPGALFLAAPAVAQQLAATGPADQVVNQVDREFVESAARDGLVEVNDARIAEQQALKDSVMNFARRMITDHGKANEQLTALASQEGLNPPEQPDARQEAAANWLKTRGGAAFDRAYLGAAIKDHEETIVLFAKEAELGQDPKLKAFAAETLPTLRRDLQLAWQTRIK